MMQWDDRKGKYIKPFTKKKVELLPHLYLEGYKLYWDFNIPKPYDIIEASRDKDFMDNYLTKVSEELEYKKQRKQQKYLNLVLSALPYIPLTGLILGVII
tara:strand:+ start:194 stop:493 length:300 start_codon:yes stop_codon:yes gene_type:complete